MEHSAQTILPISARSPDAFASYADRLGGFLRSGPAHRRSDLVATLVRGRRHFAEMRGVMRLDGARDSQLFRGEGLRALEGPGFSRNLIWCFPGQGMAIDWSVLARLRDRAVFARRFDEVLAGFEVRLGAERFAEKVAAFLPGADGAPPRPGPRGTVCDQVLVFATQVSLGALWLAQGFRPVGVVGHSVGEYAAAVFSGLLTLEEAIALVALRAGDMDAVAAEGFMCQVRAEPERLSEVLRRSGLEIACRNAPDQTVVSGPEAGFAALAAFCDAGGVRYRRLQVANAFHSALMAPAAESLRSAGFDLGGREPDLPLFETCRAEATPADGLAYWSAQLRGTVDFVGAVERVLDEIDRPVFQELGLGSVLGGFVCAIAKARPDADCGVVGGVAEGRDVVADTVANLYSTGYDVPWSALNGTEAGGIVPLPGYPFQRKAVAAPLRSGQAGPASRDALPPLGKLPPRKTQYFEISPASQGWLAGHLVDDAFVVPGAGMLAMMLEAVAPVGCRQDLHLGDIVFEAPIALKRAQDVVRIGVQIESGPSPRVALYSRARDDTRAWTRNATAVLAEAGAWPDLPSTPPDMALARMPAPDPAHELYARFAEQGLDYSDLYKRVETLTPSEAGGHARIAPFDGAAGLAPLVTALDAMLQVADWAQGETGNDTVLLPAEIGALSLAWRGDAAAAGEVRATGGACPDAHLVDRSGAPVCSLTDIRFSAEPLGDAPPPPLLIPQWHDIARLRDRRPAGEVFADAASVGDRIAADPAACADIDAYSGQIAELEALVLRGMHRRVGAQDLSRLAAQAFPLPQAADPAIGRRRQRAFADLARRALAAEDENARADTDKGREDLPLVAREYDLAMTALDLMQDYLSGAMSGEEVLFGQGRAETLRAYYQNSFILRRANDAVARIVDRRAASIETGHIRILEVGGGTGATSEGILSRLQQRTGLTVDYVFTDASPGLLRAAQARFGHIDGFRTEALDLNDPAACDRLEGRFDVVLGVDVVHATRDIRATVDRLARRTAPNGLFLLVEDTEKLAWIDLAFGMLDGWWDYCDEREAHPLLGFDAWTALLGERFDKVRGVDLCAGGDLPVVAREGLFVCSAPVAVEGARQTLRIDRAFLDGYDRTGLERLLAGWIDAGAREFVTLAEFDRLADPGLIETYAEVCTDLVKLVAARAPGARVILCGSRDAMPVAGGLEAGLARVVASEGLDIEVLALQLESFDAATVATGIDAFLQNRGGHLNALVTGGTLSVPQLLEAAREVNADGAGPRTDALVAFGGESEIALAIARHQVRAGVTRIVLAGRAPPRPSTRAAIATLRAMGAEATYHEVDVTDFQAVRALAAGVEADRPMVVNLAGHLSDASLQDIRPGDLGAVLAPKVRGSWNIVRAFAGRAAEVVLFSSTSCYLGNGGQAAHAMACAFLEELACARHPGGLRVRSVAWGPWKTIGITARMGLNSLLAKDGEAALSTRTGLAALDVTGRLEAAVCVAADLTSPKLQKRDWFRALHPLDVPPEAGAGGGASMAADPDAIGDTPVTSVVAKVLGVDCAQLKADASLDDNGVDSLQQIEIRLELEELCGTHVPLRLLGEADTLAGLETAFAETVLKRPAPAAAAVADGPAERQAPLRTLRPRVFFFEGIFGGVGGEAGLAQALGERGEVVPLASGREPDADIPACARRLADRIADLSPEGDVTLVGHSYGVMLAYSVAVELRQRGRAIAHFYALDGLMVPALSRHHVARLGDDDFEALLRKSREGSDGGLLDVERAGVKDLRRVFQTNCRLAASRQTCGPLDFPVTLVLPEEDTVTGITEDVFRDNLHRIGGEVGGTAPPPLRVLHGAGDHFSMIRPPFVHATGEALIAQLCPRDCLLDPGSPADAPAGERPAMA